MLHEMGETGVLTTGVEADCNEYGFRSCLHQRGWKMIIQP